MMRETTVSTEQGEMPALVFEPEERARNGAGLIIAQHLPVAHAGLTLDPFQLRTGERYAEAGFTCVMPWLFHHWPAELAVEQKRDAFRDDWTVADLLAADTLLRSLPGVDAERVGILGHCWGGRVAWLGACHLQHLKAAATFYGGRVKLSFADGATPPIELADCIPCPVLGIYGNEDASPSPEDVDDYQSALVAAGVAHEFVRYDEAGHGFQDFTNEERYREAQSEDAWVRAIGFFHQHLAA